MIAKKNEIQISNCVAVTEYKFPEQTKPGEKDKLDLQQIANKAQNASYNRNRFPAVVIRENEPKGTALIFDSGKIIIIGCQGKEKAYEVGNNVVKKIGKITQGKSFSKMNNQVNIEVKNLVATYNMEQIIDLTKFEHYLNAEKSQSKEGYNFKKTDTFPGLIFKFSKNRTNNRGVPTKSSLVALIFQSGKVVFTGGKDIEDIEDGVNVLKRVISEFKQKLDQTKAQ